MFDALVVMGGPMGVHDMHQFPWLAEETTYIRRAIKDGRPVLGICLGAQLIAHVLGAKIYKNTEPEIGWFPIGWTPAAQASPLASHFNETMTVFHWHNDTFDLPPGATHLASSQACRHQAFLYGERVLGLQFHLEMTKEIIEKLLTLDDTPLPESRFVQKDAAIRGESHRAETLRRGLYTLLDRWAA
jgi:GMP synthase-like glutamine amidotransferase